MARIDQKESKLDPHLYHMANLEEGRQHFQYADEELMLRYVEAGETERAMNFLDALYAEGELDKAGTFAVTALKQTEYGAVIMISTVCRAAIRGGLNELIAYERNDLYLQRVSAVQEEGGYKPIVYEALREMCELVRRQQQDVRSLHIRRCKQYIYAHLNEHLLAADIAREIGLSASYLSTLFHDHEGIALKDFIKEEKLNASVQMLLHSQESVTQIAYQLGFSSSSHFCAAFREQFGTPPGEYRNLHMR